MRFPLHTSSVFWVSAFKSFRGVSNPDFQTTFNLNVTYSNIGYKKSQPTYIIGLRLINVTQYTWVTKKCQP